MTLKTGDIIEFRIKINTIIPNDDLEKDVINEDDYGHEYSVSYSVNNGEETGGFDFKTSPGFYPSEENIEEYIKEEMADVFEEVTDYEVFDVDKSNHEYQTAKVRIKTTHTTIKKDDIFEFALTVRPLTPEEEAYIISKKRVLVPVEFFLKNNLKNNNEETPNKLKYEYRISYSNGRHSRAERCVLDEELSPMVRCDIEESIAKIIKNNCEEVTDYELFDIDKNDYDFQTAKVRIKAVKNNY